MVCEHCKQEHPPKEMATLSNGDPSKCCEECWQEFYTAHKREAKKLLNKWLEDRRDEERAGCFDPNANPEIVRKTAQLLKAQR